MSSGEIIEQIVREVVALRQRVAALETLEAEVPSTRQVIAGAGLIGGGALSADRTLNVGAGTGITVNADNVAIDTAAALTWNGRHTFRGGVNCGYSPTSPNITATLGGVWIPRSPDIDDLILDHQDELAFADRRGTVSVTPPPNSGAVANLFRDDVSHVEWIQGTSPFPITIEIDLSSNPINANYNIYYQLGLTTRSTAVVPTNVKAEVWDNSASDWVVWYDGPYATYGLSTDWGYFLLPRCAAPTGSYGVIYKLRVTIDGTNPIPVGAFFRLQRLMLYHTTAQWDPWHLHIGGGAVYGQIKVDLSSDGQLVNFRRNGVEKGSISVSGETVGLDGVGDFTWSSNYIEKMRLVGGTGNVLIGTTTDDGVNKLQVNGGITTVEGWIGANRTNNTPMIINRKSSDGTLVSFWRDAVEKGTIAVSGETVSYNAFTGSHYAWSEQPIERGMVCVLTGENRYLHDNPSCEVVYGVEQSSKANDPAVLGVLLGKLEPDVPAGRSNPLLVAAVGNATCWVIDTGRDLEPGDLLVSSEVPGYAMVVRDDQAVANVFARVAERVEWANVSRSIDVGGVPRKIRLVSVLLGAFRAEMTRAT